MTQVPHIADPASNMHNQELSPENKNNESGRADSAPNPAVPTPRRLTSRGLKKLAADISVGDGFRDGEGAEAAAAVVAAVEKNTVDEPGEGDDGDRAVSMAAADPRFTSQPPATDSNRAVALRTTCSFVTAPALITGGDAIREMSALAPSNFVAATTASERDDVDPSNPAIGNRIQDTIPGTKATGRHAMN